MNVSHRFVTIVAIPVTCLLTANIVGVKVISIGFFIFPAAVILLLLSYIFGDALTKAYGCHQLEGA